MSHPVFSGHGKGETSRRREKSRSRRRRGEHQLMPRLTIIGIEGEVMECQLETSKQSTVSFKFSQNDDHPDDIANSLVREYAAQAPHCLCIRCVEY